MGLLIKIDICKTQLQRSNMDSLQQKLIRVARKKILIFGARLWTTLHLSMGMAVGSALRIAATMVSRKTLRLARLTAGTAQCISYAYYAAHVKCGYIFRFEMFRSTEDNSPDFLSIMANLVTNAKAPASAPNFPWVK
jgi:hypothetical protein